MHINEIDLNLLRVFDAVYRARSVSRAANLLGLTQPATSQGLTRLRLLVKDALFVRAPGGVTPTPKAERLAATLPRRWTAGASTLRSGFCPRSRTRSAYSS